MRKDLLADIITKITPMVKVVLGRNKNKRKEEKKRTLPSSQLKREVLGAPR